MILIVGGERVYRGVWIVIKVCHAGHLTDHYLFVIGIELCDFKISVEVVDRSVQNIVDLLHLVSLDLPVFGMSVSETSPKCGVNLGV